MAYVGRMDPDPAWHSPLRTAPGDRVLIDAHWAQIAQRSSRRSAAAGSRSATSRGMPTFAGTPSGGRIASDHETAPGTAAGRSRRARRV